MLDGTRLRISGHVTDGREAGIRRLEDGALVEPGVALTFEALFDEQPGDRLYWQIVNTGRAALRNHDLRGTFEAGNKFKTETTLYIGDHFIECFLIRNRTCVARSGPFTVQVR
jgi:Adenylyl/Guanylyl and SMODS C-terminal sensor domain